MATEVQTRFDNDYYKSLISITENDTVYLYTVGYEQLPNSNAETFITKQDTNGNLIWQRKIDGSKDDIFYSITPTIENNIVYLYVAGWKNLSTGNIVEGFITKWDTSGNLVWQKRIDEPGDSKIYSITSTIESNTVYLYTVGYEYSSTSGNNLASLITKWDSNGNLIWQRRIGGSNGNYFYSIISTVENNAVHLYVVGYEYSSTGDVEAFITKWDTDGNLIWQRRISGTNYEYFNFITSTIENNAVYLYAVGNECLSADNLKTFITKRDTDGNLIWQRKINGSNSNYFYSIISTVESNTVYLYTVGYEKSSTGNNDEALITKWDTDGNLIWQRKLDRSSSDYFNSIISTTENNTVYLYAVGYKRSTIGDNKALITKWDTNGNLIWQRKIGVSNNNYFYSIISTIENKTTYLHAVGHEVSSTSSNYEVLATK